MFRPSDWSNIINIPSVWLVQYDKYPDHLIGPILLYMYSDHMIGPILYVNITPVGLVPYYCTVYTVYSNHLIGPIFYIFWFSDWLNSLHISPSTVLSSIHNNKPISLYSTSQYLSVILYVHYVKLYNVHIVLYSTSDYIYFCLSICLSL